MSRSEDYNCNCSSRSYITASTPGNTKGGMMAAAVVVVVPNVEGLFSVILALHGNDVDNTLANFH